MNSSARKNEELLMIADSTSVRTSFMCCIIEQQDNNDLEAN